jgi:tetratricopeptide (TPR) repeat protein
LSNPEFQDDEAPDDGFGESSRYAAHLDRGWSMLDRGDHAAARKSAQHASQLRPDSPDSAVLLGAVALAEGDPDESVEWNLRAIELDPDYLEPYAAAAQVHLFDLGEADAGLELCEEALALETLPPLDHLEMSLLAVECELSLDRRKAAENRLRTLEELTLLATALDDDQNRQVDALTELWGDPEDFDEEEVAEALRKTLILTARMARLWLDLRMADEALPWLRAVVERTTTDADAWYLLGEAESMCGNARAAAHAALQTYRLDAQLRLPRWAPRPSTLQRRVVEVLTTCPDRDIRAQVESAASLVVLVHESPSLELVLEGIDPRAPALALAGRTATNADPDAPPTLTGIAIYRRNIARLSKDAEQFNHELRHAVLDELAAFLQLDDDARVALGLPALNPPPPPENEDEGDDEDEGKPRRRRKRTRMHS